MAYTRGDEIEVVIDRDGLSQDHGIAHLPDETMVIVSGAGGRVGQAVLATVMDVVRTPIGSSLLANVKV